MDDLRSCLCEGEETCFVVREHPSVSRFATLHGSQDLPFTHIDFSTNSCPILSSKKAATIPYVTY